MIIDIVSNRFETQSDGSTKEISIDEPIQIGLFSKHPSIYTKGEEPMYIKVHTIDKEKSQIILIVDKEPRHIAIDPYGTRSDENYSDNLFSL